MFIRLFSEPCRTHSQRFASRMKIRKRTFWHSSMIQSHRSSPHAEKYLRAYPTIFFIDCWELEVVQDVRNNE